MFPHILDVDGNGQFNLLAKAGTDTVDNGGGGATHSVSGGANDPFTDWIYWVSLRIRRQVRQVTMRSRRMWLPGPTQVRARRPPR